jgi:hypothetical protein
VADVLVRSNQLVSSMESMYSGENILIISPDSDVSNLDPNSNFIPNLHNNICDSPNTVVRIIISTIILSINIIIHIILRFISYLYSVDIIIKIIINVIHFIMLIIPIEFVYIASCTT